MKARIERVAIPISEVPGGTQFHLESGVGGGIVLNDPDKLLPQLENIVWVVDKSNNVVRLRSDILVYPVLDNTGLHWEDQDFPTRTLIRLRLKENRHCEGIGFLTFEDPDYVIYIHSPHFHMSSFGIDPISVCEWAPIRPSERVILE